MHLRMISCFLGEQEQRRSILLPILSALGGKRAPGAAGVVGARSVPGRRRRYPPVVHTYMRLLKKRHFTRSNQPGLQRRVNLIFEVDEHKA